MRYLLVFLIVLLMGWRWRTSRTAMERKAQTKRAAAPTAQQIVQCGQCGVHFPAQDGIEGSKAIYCSAEHRRQAES